MSSCVILRHTQVGLGEAVLEGQRGRMGADVISFAKAEGSTHHMIPPDDAVGGTHQLPDFSISSVVWAESAAAMTAPTRTVWSGC